MFLIFRKFTRTFLSSVFCVYLDRMSVTVRGSGEPKVRAYRTGGSRLQLNWCLFTNNKPTTVRNSLWVREGGRQGLGGEAFAGAHGYQWQRWPGMTPGPLRGERSGQLAQSEVDGFQVLTLRGSRSSIWRIPGGKASCSAVQTHRGL